MKKVSVELLAVDRRRQEQPVETSATSLLIKIGNKEPSSFTCLVTRCLHLLGSPQIKEKNCTKNIVAKFFLLSLCCSLLYMSVNFVVKAHLWLQRLQKCSLK